MPYSLVELKVIQNIVPNAFSLSHPKGNLPLGGKKIENIFD
jgi:hypothetical protein